MKTKLKPLQELVEKLLWRQFKQDLNEGRVCPKDQLIYVTNCEDTLDRYYQKWLVINRFADIVDDKNARTVGDYDVWHQPCSECGTDPGKGTELRPEEDFKRCAKCGNRLRRDFTDRALKKKNSYENLDNI